MEGHAAELEALFAHSGWVRRLARSLVGEQHAADLVQETWVAALEREPLSGAPLRRWTAAVVRNLAQRHWRGEARRSERERATARPAAHGDASTLEDLEISQRLFDAVRSLAEPYRTAIHLRYFQDLPPREIAQRLGVPVPTVHTRLHRALDLLRERLDRRHDGDRGAWMALFAPLAKPPSAALVGGVVLQAKSIVAAAVLIALGAGSAWYVASRSAGPRASGALAPNANLSTPGPLADSPAPTGSAGGERALAKAPTSSASPTDAALEIVVTDASETPLAQVGLLVLDELGATQQATTDERGRARLEPRASRGEVFVKPVATAPQRRMLELGSGEQRIVLEPGATVAGWITVDGAGPQGPLAMRLTSDHGFLVGRELPQVVREFLGFQGVAEPALQCSTDARGGFRFEGLETQWSGTILAPRGYVLRGELGPDLAERSVRLDRPQQSVAIDLLRLPVLRGRIVDGAGLVPEGSLSLTYALTWSDGSSMYNNASVDAQGRFELPLRETDFRSVRLSAQAPSERTTVLLSRADVGDDLDVGDIVLAADRGLSFRVVDPSGAPIVGALGQLVGGPEIATTDASGAARLLQVVAGAERLLVGARGWASAELDVDAANDAPVLVTLSPANRLSVALETLRRASTGGLQLRIDSGRTPLFPETGDWCAPSLAIRLTVARVTSCGHDRDGKGWTVFVPDDQGRVELQHVAQDTELTATVLDELGNSILSQTIAPLGPEEQREVVLHVGEAGRALHGTIVDADGRALPGTSITIASTKDADNSAGRAADSAGSFRFEAIAEREVEVKVAHEGFVTLWLGRVALVGPDTERNIVLQRGRTIAIDVVDEHGHAIEDGTVRAERIAGAGAWGTTTVGRGKLELRDMPGEELELTLDLSRRRYVQRLPAGASSARFQVPAHGRLEVTWILPEGSDPGDFILSARPADDSRPVLEEMLLGSVGNVTAIRTLLPGEYEVCVARPRDGELPEVVLGPQRVVVEPDATAAVSIGP